MLRSLFLYVRQKPKAVRNQIALAISSVFTGLVALVWLVGQVDRPEPSSLADTAVGAPEYEKPFAGLFDQVKQQLAAVRESVSAATSTAAEATTTEIANGSVLDMTLSSETIASTSVLLPESTNATTSTTTVSVVTSTTASTTTVSQPVPTEPYRVIQIATTSKSVATTTPPLY